MRMRHAAVVAGLALGMASGLAEAATTTVDFTFDLSGSTVASGDFMFNSAKQGLINFSDLNTFNETIDADSYNLAYVNSGGFSQYFALGFNATTNTFEPQNISGQEFYLTAIKSGLDAGFASIPGSGVKDYAGNEYDDAVFSFSVTSTSTVPLPASAPMFGAALVALGAVGYGLKRKGKAAA